MSKRTKVGKTEWTVAALFFFLVFTGCAIGAGQDQCPEARAVVGDAAYLGCVEDDVHVFKGIRYAKAERWQAPTPVDPSGEVVARNFGFVCAQSPLKDYMSEDCLYLNVWAPADAKKRPVMVFIHGGSFLYGTGADPTYNGANLARDRNIVVVTLNYRLGVFGSYYKSDETSGNFGILDQAMALRWVHENIRSFGGNPAKVTIAGESAGSMSVGIQLGNPEVAGYFRSAVIESSYHGLFYKSSEEAARLAELMDLYRRWWCGDQACSTQKLLDIQAKIMVILQTGGLQSLYSFMPYMDGVVIQKQPIEVDSGKPVILGTNAEESLIFTGGYKEMTSEYYSGLLLGLFGAELAETISKTPRYDATKQKPYIAVNNLVNDAFFICGTDYILSNQKSAASTAYGYDFTYVPSFGGFPATLAMECDYVPCHTDELPFVFDNLPPGDESTADERMANKMSRYWSHFVKRGELGMMGKIDWKPYEGNGRYILKPCVSDVYTRDEECNCDFWADVYKKGGTSGLIDRLLDAVY